MFDEIEKCIRHMEGAANDFLLQGRDTRAVEASLNEANRELAAARELCRQVLEVNHADHFSFMESVEDAAKACQAEPRQPHQANQEHTDEK